MNFTYIKKTFLYCITSFLLFVACQVENGILGLNSLTILTKEPSSANCKNGGIKLEIGLDKNSNGSLEVEEINVTNYYCHGLNGSNSLTALEEEPSGLNCENGGYKINSGIDFNNNNVLDIDEITASSFICNGINGKETLTKITNEPKGMNCENGGMKIEAGKDINENGILDGDEVISTTYGCNADDGKSSLVIFSDIEANSNCSNGGIIIKSGIDNNNNAILEESEIKATKTICNMSDGRFNEEIRLVLFSSNASANATNEIDGKIVDNGKIIGFNKNNLNSSEASIIYTVYASTSNKEVSCFVELYNLTDNMIIQNSTLSTNIEGFPGELLISDNIIENLPNKEIDLALRFRTEKEGEDVYITMKSEIIINYRKD